MFLSNLELTNEQIAQKEEEFQALVLNVPEAEAAFKELREFFANLSLEESLKKYRMTYWRWYTQLTWNNLNGLSKDDLISIAFGQQVPMALLLDFDVWKSLMWYFVANDYFENDVDSIYIKVKESFLGSEAVMGIWQEKNVTVSEMAKEVSSVYSTGDSLMQADFESRLQQIMFPQDEISKKYLTADPEEVKERFLDLVSCFQTFTEDNIWYIADSFLNPEKYQNVAVGEGVPVPTNITAPVTATPSKFTVPETIRPSASQVTVPKPPQPTPAAEPQAPLSMEQIKSQIESQFKKDADGNFVDIEGVMAKLGELAEKNNDPKIAEMVYFDETENKFKWNV